MSKKLISLVLAIAMIFGLGIIAQAEESTAKLYTVYGNGMLFEQNKEAIFAGEGGTPGNTIKVQLLNENYWPIKNSSAKVNDDGTFEVSFIGLPGSYNEYTVVLTENGEEFAKLENVVFGELWLASGQSNMMFPLGQSVKGLEMFNNGVLASKWLRVLIEPAYPTYNGTNAIPVNPQNDIIDAKWINGESTEIYGMSAVAYFFAEKLMKELDMPVGILNSSLGGTTIRSWLSREAIDADSLLKQELKSSGYYIEESEWNEQKIDIYGNMTANYNLRTYAYRNFFPSGLIWYQGESDLMNAKNTDLYTKSFNALQQMYTDMFNYGDEFFPIIYTQIAPYSYNEFTLSDWNYNYAKCSLYYPTAEQW
ncbi:MAG: sialate O-acetylesterase [Acutalibacteraceae bacterium]|nr:sialate O-acetylesterase [Acutalibacteraceae bacterium]